MWFFLVTELGLSASMFIWKGEAQSSLHTHQSSTQWDAGTGGMTHRPAICDLDLSFVALENQQCDMQSSWEKQPVCAETREPCPTCTRNRHRFVLVLMSSPYPISASSSFSGWVTKDYKKDILPWLRVFINFLDFFSQFPYPTYILWS